MAKSATYKHLATALTAAATAQAKPAAAPRTITVLAATNPKKVGSASAARFALYKTGMSVAAYVEACVTAGQSRRNATADLDWDTKRKFIVVA